MAFDYKDTLNLPQTQFPMKANLARKEVELLEFWQENRIYQKMQKKEEVSRYILHDGPPYANGHIHLGHTLNKVLKDIIVKYKTMRGHYAPFVPGWDCHGLPIEHQVDKKLGSKKEATPLLEKRRLCREYAHTFLEIQREEFRRLGVFGDWEKPYITMDYSYEATIVREFYKFARGGLVYKGKKPVHWCPTCVTALAEAEVEYGDKESPSIYVKFKVEDAFDKVPLGEGKKTFFVIWTTTPWTLPANMALTVHPDFTYKIVSTPEEDLILAQDLIPECMKKAGFVEGQFTVSHGAWTGNDLEGIVCKHPWIDRNVKIIVGPHVTLEQGTGVVHTAPGHGEEDFAIGVKYDLEVCTPVDDKGRFIDEIEEFSGQYVFKANEGIINKINGLSMLLGSPETITHAYPHCWRCKNPVIFRATEQWFISMEKNSLRTRALEEIRKTEWIPAWGMDRIYGMVEKRPDWCISRQRAWGVPIPMFRCEACKGYIYDNNIMQTIERECELHGADVWFQKSAHDFIPKEYRCQTCGAGNFSKEMDILDVWFDSGVSHAAVTEADDRLTAPADLYLEGSDQHRGWFQSSLLASVGTRAVAPYRAVLTHGFVVDGQGKKMSKSLGNVISPQEITDKQGAEILRLWSSSADYREDMRISNEILARLVEAYRKMRNTARFLLGNIYDLDPALCSLEKKNNDNFTEIDRLALHMLQRLIEKVTHSYETFAFYEVYHAVYNFCVIDMSAFYLDILKDRLYTYKSDSAERRSAQGVLFNILISLAKMLAPILSFTAEEIWQHLPGKRAESVFLSTFPVANPLFIDNELENTWKLLIAIRDEVNKALEIKRKDKFIGNSLEAKIMLYSDQEFGNLLQKYGSMLATIFIVSQVQVNDITDAPEDAFQSGDMGGIAIAVQKADGSKCQRCWNWDESVGNYGDNPDICKKCYNVVTA